MTDVSSTIYEASNGRKEHRIKIMKSVREQLSFDTSERYFAVPVVDRSGFDFDDYEIKLVPHACVASGAGKHFYYDQASETHQPAFLVTQHHRIEALPGSIDLPEGEFNATVVDDTIFLQLVTEEEVVDVPDAPATETVPGSVGSDVEVVNDVVRFTNVEKKPKMHLPRAFINLLGEHGRQLRFVYSLVGTVLTVSTRPQGPATESSSYVRLESKTLLPIPDVAVDAENWYPATMRALSTDLWSISVDLA
uniref:Tail protein n=1 Tax=Dinoroseobacter phage vB_DshS_R26L TaxID=3161158 RepID=A0AAU7VGE4_9CAUD